MRGTRAVVIPLVLGAALAAPALVVAADPTTTTTDTQPTTTTTAGGEPTDTAPATDTVPSQPPPAQPRKQAPAETAKPASGNDSPTATAAASAEYPVDMTQQLRFDPPTLTVHVGDKVTWRNTSGGGIDHTATASDGSFDSGTVKPSGNFSHVFNKAGTYKYFCTFHKSSGMRGTIKVEASGGSSGSGGTPSSGGTSGSGGTNGSTGSTSGGGSPAFSGSTGSSGSLPSTGADLILLALLGGDLLLVGLVLREALAARRDYS